MSLPSATHSGRRIFRIARRRWRGWRGVAIILTLAAAPLFYLGCSTPEARYRTLSMFFDGVPPPAGLLVELPEWARDPNRPGSNQAGATTQPVAAATQPKDFFFHKPYADRNCKGCHDLEKGFQALQINANLCQKCHRDHIQLEPEDWVHGPTVLGQCNLCHLAHKSEFPGLAVAAQPELCLRCHGDSFLEENAFHAALPDKTCSNCHDPHAAGNRLLLADSRTYRWRQKKQIEVKHGHPKWTKEDCARCHYVEKSNAMRPGVDQACLSCHDQLLKPAEGVKLHKAVAEDHCTACHTPHASRRPHLVREDAEAICFKCHKLEEIQKPEHPHVTRADCTICHAGHSSPEPHLLRPLIAEQLRPLSPLPKPATPPTTQPIARRSLEEQP